MGRPIHKLDDKQLQSWVKQAKASTLTRRMMKGDGGGLWFHLAPPHGASWLFRYAVDGKERLMGLGSYPDLSLAKARERATEQRRLLLEGVDPLDARQGAKLAKRLDRENAKTFRECAQAYIRAHGGSWRNPAHAAQWPSTLETYVYPIFGDLPVAQVDQRLVMAVLIQETEKDGVTGPLWDLKSDTARKVQQRIKLVLDWAKAAGYRTGDNPAQWAGNLSPLLARVSKIKEHHTFLPHQRVGAFMADLRSRKAISALALEFTILTAVRTKETIGATWGEIDLDGKLWTIPAKRMKAAKEHRVALSDAAVAVLRKMFLPNHKPDPAAYVFPGGRKGKPLSNMAMATLLQKRMGVKDDKGELVTVHGFRASFSTWARETTSFPRDLIEVALAHRPKDKAEEAYQHSDMVERRRKLMEAWATLCARPANDGKVKPLFAEATA